MVNRRQCRASWKSMCKKAVLDLVQTKIAIIFNSSKYNCKELLKGAKSILGTAPIIGCTTYGGIITQEGYITSKMVISLEC